MTAQEFNDQFDVLYNNITSNQAPGLDEYEKSVFLTKAQDEIIKNYFLKQSNPKLAGFDNNQKRQIDFSNLIVSETLATDTKNFVSQPNAVSVNLDNLSEKLLLIINERIEVVRVYRNYKVIPLVIKSISFDEYDRLMQKPFKYPTYNQAWRLMVNGKISDIVIGPGDTVRNYYIRYIRKPKPIIVGELGNNVSIDDLHSPQTPVCELDPILHQEILQRAVELAKIAWANPNDNVQTLIQTGARSE